MVVLLFSERKRMTSHLQKRFLPCGERGRRRGYSKEATVSLPSKPMWWWWWWLKKRRGEQNSQAKREGLSCGGCFGGDLPLAFCFQFSLLSFTLA
jgi:hypothetical protein